MLRDLNISVNGQRDSTDPREGVRGSEIPTGFAVPAFLLNDVDPAFPERLYSLEILTLPAAGMLYLDKAGVGSFTGAPAGTYSGTQRVRKFDPDVGMVSSAVGNYEITVSDPASQQIYLSGFPCFHIGSSGTGAITQISSLINFLGLPCTQSGLSSIGPVSQAHSLRGAVSAQGNASAFVAINQVIDLAGVSCSGSASSPNARMIQVHKLAVTPDAQLSDSSAAVIGQVVYQAGFINLIGTTARQDNDCGTGRATQGQFVAGLHLLQSNSSGVGALVISFGSIDVVAQKSTQDAFSSAAPMSQVHSLHGASCVQANTYPDIRIAQVHDLVSPPLTQLAFSSARPVVHAHYIAADACASSATTATGAVVHTHSLAAAGGAMHQANATSTGYVDQVHMVVAAGSVQVNRCVVGVVDATVQTLNGAPGSQSNSSMETNVHQVHYLAGMPAFTVHQSSVGVAEQQHAIVGASALVRPSSTVGRVSQDYALSADALVQKNEVSNDGVFVSHRLIAAATTVDNESAQKALGDLSLTHDLTAGGTLQRNPSLASGITCIQELVAMSVGQINISPSTNLKGKVEIFMPPESDRFRFTSSGASDNSNW